jgi:hypothetical protein
MWISKKTALKNKIVTEKETVDILTAIKITIVKEKENLIS